MSNARNLSKLGAAPAFSATVSGDQAVSANVATKVTLGTVEFDTSNAFASSRFTPTVPGYYRFDGDVYGQGTSITTVIAYLYKNGSVAKVGSFGAPNSATNAMSTVSGLIYMNGTTDYVELFGYIQAGTSTTFKLTAGGYQSRLSGCLVRGA